MKINRLFFLGLVLSLVAFLLIGCNKGEEKVVEVKKAEPYAHPEALISADQLKRILMQPNLTIIDTRPQEDYLQEHIPGAIHFKVKLVLDPNRKGRFASAGILSRYMRQYGINSTDHIVVYSDDYSHARLWCSLNMYGIKNVQILNGGFAQWKNKGYETATGRERKAKLGKFVPGEKTNTIINTEQVSAAVRTSDNVIIDARSLDEYSSGHIPGAINIPCDQLINEDGTFKSISELKKIFNKYVTSDKQIIVYSRNATRSSYLFFVLNKLLGYENVKIYDGYRIYWAPHKAREKGIN
ncbi:sulfurtransferase [Desulfolucanica intricata]|uniref:sulfurtransferase n=1 Tax=Desulfolucanica intricata TaxID=1285191 RepID=UPI0008372BDD|nr:rhodanese-like domain-containing protein [Desulfolucanica intricata]